MKTTQNWSRMLLAVMAATVLAFGLIMAGCDNGNGGGGDNNGGGGSSKPVVLAANATYVQAMAKLDEIIDYSGSPAEVKSNAEYLKTSYSGSSSIWDSLKASVVPQINSLISQIP